MALKVTMLDLVTTVSEVADSEAEVVATVAYLINSGKVVLRGNFAGARIDLQRLGGLPRGGGRRRASGASLAA